jgi:UDP:flavonoid glycosyltransferase YjiC (YdhE family)
VRLLFTFVGGRGHFEPLAPVARAAREAGHEVAFGCAPPTCSMVETGGFDVFAMGDDARSDPPERSVLLPVDRDREERDLRERFAQRAALLRVPLVVALCQKWRPDVVVCDETDFGAMVAAEQLGLPHVTVLVIAAGGFVRADVVGSALAELRARHGLPPDPKLEMLHRHLVLAPFPASYRDPTDPLPATSRVLAPSGCAADDSATRTLDKALPEAPVVYFTLGTIFNMESGDLFERVLAGLRELPVNVIATVGDEIDPDDLGPQPANVRVERFIRQSSVLPHCDLVISHAGSGSVLGALAHGLPSVLIPLGADQPWNAARCEELGVAKVLDAMQATPEGVRMAVSQMLNNETARRNAERMRDEIQALPEPAQAITWIEELVAAR